MNLHSILKYTINFFYLLFLLSTYISLFNIPSFLFVQNILFLQVFFLF